MPELQAVKISELDKIRREIEKTVSLFENDKDRDLKIKEIAASALYLFQALSDMASMYYAEIRSQETKLNMRDLQALANVVGILFDKSIEAKDIFTEKFGTKEDIEFKVDHKTQHVDKLREALRILEEAS